MRTEATITLDDIEEFLNQITPLRLDLGGKRFLYIGKPKRLEFVVGVGIQVETVARVRWTVGAIGFPVILPSITLTLTPALVQTGAGDSIVFSLHVDHADFQFLPGFVDRELVSQINNYLDSDAARLTWKISDSLSFSLKVPVIIAPGRTVEVSTSCASLRITRRAIVLELQFHTEVPPNALADVRVINEALH